MNTVTADTTATAATAANTATVVKAATPAIAAEQVAFIVYLPFKPAQKQRARGMLMEIVAAMSREPEFINTWVHELQDEPDTVVLYETWACSRDDFITRQLGKPYRTAYEAVLPELLASERRLVFLTPLAGFPARRE